MTGRHKSADLERLDEALIALAETNEEIMFLSELDGFFAGLIVCPEMIPPSLWLQEVWGGAGEPRFESLAAFQTAFDLIMGHYNRVSQMLSAPAFYGPVMSEDSSNGQVLFGDWVEGFVRAVRLRPTGWQHLIESDDQEAVAAFSLLLEIPLIGVCCRRVQNPTLSLLRRLVSLLFSKRIWLSPTPEPSERLWATPSDRQ